MILPGLTLTPALTAWLRAAHDDGQLPLLVSQVSNLWTGSVISAIVVGDAGMAGDRELSPTEQIEVRAILAAHEAQPLKMPGD